MDRWIERESEGLGFIVILQNGSLPHSVCLCWQGKGPPKGKPAENKEEAKETKEEPFSMFTCSWNAVPLQSACFQMCSLNFHGSRTFLLPRKTKRKRKSPQKRQPKVKLKVLPRVLLRVLPKVLQHPTAKAQALHLKVLQRVVEHQLAKVVKQVEKVVKVVLHQQKLSL